MREQLSQERRRGVIFAAAAVILATFPTLVLLPMRQAHWLSDPPYFMGTGFCLALAIVCLTKAIAVQMKKKQTSSTFL